jgi:acyl-CoA reductase-like NAD-dependent aldehyde dehydrogenase
MTIWTTRSNERTRPITVSAQRSGATDLERAFDVAMRIEAGTVWINEHMVFDFGITARGAKFSGFGGELGPEGFNSYTQGYVVYQTRGNS